MVKWLIVMAYMQIVLLVGSIFNQDVSIDVSVPETVTAGNEIEVNVTLNKGNLESFSRLVQELPGGLSASSITSSNADFTFKDNKVRLIWLKMPSDEQKITVSYKIKFDKRLKGTFDLGGKFAYIENNERRAVEIASRPITINPNPDVDPSLLVDVKDFNEKVIPDLRTQGQPNVACIRQTPVATNDADKSYVVNVLVNKENAQKFAKIEENIPAGYSAIKIDAKDGIFVFKNGVAKLLWMNMPAEPYFTISYRLVPINGTTTAPVLKGQFSYVNDDKTMVIDIAQTDANVATLSEAEIQKLVNSTNTFNPVMPMVMASTNEPESQVSPKPIVAPVDSAKPIQNIAKPNVKQTVAIPDCTNLAPKPQKNKKNLFAFLRKKSQDEKNKAYLLEPEQGVYFRVQLAAGHNTVDIKRYFKRLKINDEVRLEEHEGWRKYSIGSYAEYKQARDYRIHIWNTTPVADAFVAAYNTGKRITVQEALMVNNQQWYK